MSGTDCTVCGDLCEGQTWTVLGKTVCTHDAQVHADEFSAYLDNEGAEAPTWGAHEIDVKIFFDLLPEVFLAAYELKLCEEYAFAPIRRLYCEHSLIDGARYARYTWPAFGVY